MHAEGMCIGTRVQARCIKREAHRVSARECKWGHRYVSSDKGRYRHVSSSAGEDTYPGKVGMVKHA